jgi:hypothetical protein
VGAVKLRHSLCLVSASCCRWSARRFCCASSASVRDLTGKTTTGEGERFGAVKTVSAINPIMATVISQAQNRAFVGAASIIFQMALKLILYPSEV